MPKTLTQLTVFASGTSETESERSALRRVAKELNKQLEKTHNITLRVRAWPDDVRPGVNSYSQAELNRQLGSEYDIYLGVLGPRFGTPTPRAGSGTEEEFNLALTKLQADSQSVRLLFYFRRSAEDPFTLDVEQLQKVGQFRSALAENGVVYRDFTDTSEFVQQTRDHLYNLIIDEWIDGHWRRIEGLGQPPSQKPPPAVPASAPDESPKPPETGGAAPVPEGAAKPTDSGDELGFLEYIEKFHDSVPALIEAFEQMSGHTTRMNERIRERTTEAEAIQQEQEKHRHIGGSRAQQEQVVRAKEMVNAAADDLNEYAESMSAALGQYRTHSRAMLSSFRLALQSGGDLWTSETREENRIAVKQMSGAMEATLQHITEFQGTIRRIPALTGRFKQARNRTATVLGDLVAELTFSVTEAKQILAELGGQGTEAA